MSSPRDSGQQGGDEHAVLYLDGGLTPAERAAFERKLEESSDLRSEVDRLRKVRSLVCGLTRKRAILPSFETLLERLDAEPGAALQVVLRNLPRKEAPADLLDRILDRFFERDGRRRPTLKWGAVWRGLVVPGLAAAALLLVALNLHGWRERPAPRFEKHGALKGVRFQFDVSRSVPGATISGTTDSRTYLPRPGGGR
ncbi:MAG: hypothetical protein V2A76_15315 [Planctomycetota bacterium]